MTRIALIAAIMLLPGCATTAAYVNCDSARAAAQAAKDAVDYACPVPVSDK